MGKTSPSRTADKIIIRLPDGMRDALTTLAHGNGRTTNAEVVAALDMWIKNSGLLGMPPATLDRLSAAFARTLESDPEIGPLLRRNWEERS